MRLLKALLVSLPLAALVVSGARDASACGGCFVQQSENTQVTGHRMILSISQAQTTLWDQIAYSGDPQSFAWVLPIKGTVGIGLSSDALFESLDQSTSVTIQSPQIVCPPPPDCGGLDNAGASFGSGAGGGAASSSGAPPVTVIAQQVVGPYETVQLQSTDPGALEAWLASHGYEVPADVAPVIASYVKDGFDFLALKLVPGQGIQAMRPVRVTTQGASGTLPLRMVAAGTGAVTPITLWIMGEGRYEPSNMPSFTIAASELVWDWDAHASNYTTLEAQKAAATKGSGWLVQAGEPMSMLQFQSSIESLVQYQPAQSGYDGDMNTTPLQEADADLQALFGTINASSLWVTRLHGELARSALGADLQLGASADQSTVDRYLQAQKAVGSPPPCPDYGTCSGTSDGGGGGGAPGINGGWDFWTGDVGSPKRVSGGCAISGPGGFSATLSPLALAAAMAFARARRRSRRPAA